MIRELFLAALVVLTFSRSDGCSCSEYFFIKHVHSGLCLANADPNAVLRTCHKDDTGQQWKWSGSHGRHLVTKYGNGRNGIYVDAGSYAAHKSMSKAIWRIGQVKVGGSHNGADHSWTFQNGYLKNGWNWGVHGATDLRLAPMKTRLFYIAHPPVRVNRATLHDGEVNGIVGALNWGPVKEYNGLFKWSLDNIPCNCQDYFFIKHEHSGLCLANEGNHVAKLRTCNKRNTEQQWKWSGTHLVTGYGDGRYGLYVDAFSYRDNSRRGNLAHRIGQVKIGGTHSGADLSWTFQDGYLKNSWNWGDHGATDLRLVPMSLTHSSSGLTPNLSNGAADGLVGAINHGAVSAQDNLFKWKLEKINF